MSCSILPASSVVLLEIDTVGIPAVEFKCDTPWPIDMNCIADRSEAYQRMKAEAGQIHIFRLLGNVQAIKAHQDSFMKFGVDFCRLPFVEELRERLVPE
jgi:hypothetical protein